MKTIGFRNGSRSKALSTAVISRTLFCTTQRAVLLGHFLSLFDERLREGGHVRPHYNSKACSNKRNFPQFAKKETFDRTHSLQVKIRSNTCFVDETGYQQLVVECNTQKNHSRIGVRWLPTNIYCICLSIKTMLNVSEYELCICYVRKIWPNNMVEFKVERYAISMNKKTD